MNIELNYAVQQFQFDFVTACIALLLASFANMTIFLASCILLSKKASVGRKVRMGSELIIERSVRAIIEIVVPSHPLQFLSSSQRTT